MSKRPKSKGSGWSWDQSQAAAAAADREFEARRVAEMPFRTVQEALDFAQNLCLVAVAGIQEAGAQALAATVPDEAEFHASERHFWRGVRAACIALTEGTTISR